MTGYCGKSNILVQFSEIVSCYSFRVYGLVCVVNLLNQNAYFCRVKKAREFPQRKKGKLDLLF